MICQNLNLKGNIVTLMFCMFQLPLFSQNNHQFLVQITKQNSRKISFSLTNNSKDTVNIKSFRRTLNLKDNYFNIKKYYIKQDTLNVDFSKSEISITCAKYLDYYIEGDKVSINYNFCPNEKMFLTILLNENDDTQIKFVSIQLNKSDKISFKR